MDNVMEKITIIPRELESSNLTVETGLGIKLFLWNWFIINPTSYHAELKLYDSGVNSR